MLRDLHSVFHSDPTVTEEVKTALPKGSYFYAAEKTWNLFDRFFVSANLLDKKSTHLDVSSFRIVSDPELTHTIVTRDHPNGIVVPKRYEFNADTAEKAGHSDHLPIVVKLVKI